MANKITADTIVRVLDVEADGREVMRGRLADVLEFRDVDILTRPVIQAELAQTGRCTLGFAHVFRLEVAA